MAGDGLTAEGLIELPELEAVKICEITVYNSLI